jgi:hypothetical protein
MKLKRFHIQRLEKLAAHLEKGKLGHEEFDFGVVNVGDFNKPGCGTSGCAMGECPIVFRKYWEFGPVTYTIGGDQRLPRLRGVGYASLRDHVSNFFGISTSACDHLFYPCDQNPEIYGGRRLSYTATKEQVARNIRAFVKLVKLGKFG